jgi:hypothetical protein
MGSDPVGMYSGWDKLVVDGKDLQEKTKLKLKEIYGREEEDKIQSL